MIIYIVFRHRFNNTWRNNGDCVQLFVQNYLFNKLIIYYFYFNYLFKNRIPTSFRITGYFPSWNEMKIYNTNIFSSNGKNRKLSINSWFNWVKIDLIKSSAFTAHFQRLFVIRIASHPCQNSYRYVTNLKKLVPKKT